MTDPVILLGTQSNGETLPVQVNSFGQLVAEGLEGSEGPEGPEGPAGGSFPLPADPYEGALLGWLNGGLAWVGTPPVPIPPGVFGPITAWDAQSGVLSVEGEIPAAVGNGVYIWQCNQDGTYFTLGWDTSQVWSDVISTSDTDFQFPFSNGFNGITTAGGSVTNECAGWASNGPITLTLPAGLTVTNEVVVYYASGLGGKCDISVNIGGNTLNSNTTGYGGFSEFTGASGSLNSITLTSTQGGVRFYAIEIDGAILVDPDESLNMRVNSVQGEFLIGVPSATVDFTIGKYLFVPGQRVAPWVLYGNDPTSLIDHLRSS